MTWPINDLELHVGKPCSEGTVSATQTRVLAANQHGWGTEAISQPFSVPRTGGGVVRRE